MARVHACASIRVHPSVSPHPHIKKKGVQDHGRDGQGERERERERYVER